MVSLGSHPDTLKNIPGLDLAVLADERRALGRLEELLLSESTPGRYDERRQWALTQASALRAERRRQTQTDELQPTFVRPLAMLDALDWHWRRGEGDL